MSPEGMFGRPKRRSPWRPTPRLMQVQPPPKPTESIVTPQGAEDPPTIRWFSGRCTHCTNRCPYCQTERIQVRRTKHIGDVTIRYVRCCECSGHWKTVDGPADEHSGH